MNNKVEQTFKRIENMGFVISNQDMEADELLLSKITLHHGDITKQETDAIFVPVPFKKKTSSMLDQAVREIAGEEYSAFVDELADTKKAGEASAAPSGNVPCKHIIACITPKWSGGFMGEDRVLVKCFENAIKTAVENGCRKIAVPVFLTGNHGYPKPRAVRLAVKTFVDNANGEDFDEIRFVAFKEEIYGIFLDRLGKYGWSDNESR
jgi:O-acetyl-ADP-ribose deacetylase (regulator of RNase III)